MKNQKGVTLIALVITIIVLLILATVSIAMLTSDGSIAGNGKEAQIEIVKGNLKEAIGLAAQDLVIAKYDSDPDNEDVINAANIKSAIDAGKYMAGGYEITVVGETLTIADAHDRKITATLTIDAEGKLTEIAMKDEAADAK